MNPPYGGLYLSSMAACGPKSPQVAPGDPVQVSTGAPWYVSNLQLHSDLGVLYLAEHIRSIAQSLYVSRCGEPSSSATWEVPRLLKGRVKTRQNLHEDTKFYLGLLSIWRSWKPSAETIPTAGLTTRKSWRQIPISCCCCCY